MKFTESLRIIVLALLAVAAGTVQPDTIKPAFLRRSNILPGRPELQLLFITATAKTDAQTADIQDQVAQMVQNTYANFSSYSDKQRASFLRTFNKMLGTNLLRDDQKAFLQNTVIPAANALTAAQPVQTVQQDNSNDLVVIKTTLEQSGITPDASLAVAIQEPAPVVTGGTLIQTLPVAAPMTMAPISAPEPVKVEIQAPRIVGGPGSVLPMLTPTNINAIIQHPTQTTAEKATALTTLINTTQAHLPVDTTTATSVAQAVQDIFNAQKPGDAHLIAGLLAAATQKPVLTEDQNNYVKTALVPSLGVSLPMASVAQAQAIPQATAVVMNAAVMPVAYGAVVQPQQVVMPTQQVQMMPSQLPQAQPQQFIANMANPFAQQQAQQVPAAVDGFAPITTFAQPQAQQQFTQLINTLPVAVPQSVAGMVMHHDLEETIKGLYLQMQSADGKTFDSATQASFGASLVESFNGVVELQSYMSQLLIAAQTTPLLNKAQHKYVTDTMVPNLDQVSDTTPTKTLDQAVTDTPAAKRKKKKGKKHAATTAATDTAGKKKKGKKKKGAKHAAAASATMAATRADATHTDAAATADHTPATNVTATSTNATPAPVAAKKKKGKKKLKKTKKVNTITTPDASIEALPTA